MGSSSCFIIINGVIGKVCPMLVAIRGIHFYLSHYSTSSLWQFLIKVFGKSAYLCFFIFILQRTMTGKKERTSPINHVCTLAHINIHLLLFLCSVAVVFFSTHIQVKTKKMISHRSNCRYRQARIVYRW